MFSLDFKQLLRFSLCISLGLLGYSCMFMHHAHLQRLPDNNSGVNGRQNYPGNAANKDVSGFEVCISESMKCQLGFMWHCMDVRLPTDFIPNRKIILYTSLLSELWSSHYGIIEFSWLKSFKINISSLNENGKYFNEHILIYLLSG